MRLTTAALGNLKLDGGATDKIIFDDEVPGFGIRIRASGAQTWIFQYKIAGKNSTPRSWSGVRYQTREGPRDRG